MPDALAALAERCDLLLIDTPPLLAVSDAMTIATRTDALILVAGVNQVRRATLAETRRVLEACPAFTLGFIATGSNGGGRYPYRKRGRPVRAGRCLRRPSTPAGPTRVDAVDPRRADGAACSAPGGAPA